jgi:hypothetical protein
MLPEKTSPYRLGSFEMFPNLSDLYIPEFKILASTFLNCITHQGLSDANHFGFGS